ncbi:MAG: hypothetical protein U0350_13650 [Caldilineaceae bacterium]
MSLSRSPRLTLMGVVTLIIAVFITIPQPVQSAPSAPLPSIIFVARSHLATQDDVFQDEVGPAGQFGTGLTKFAPGSKLVRRNADGSLFVYNTPGLVDVQSPDVNFDATKIVFAGATTLLPDTKDSGWRLYEINVDGSNFHPLTLSDRNIVIPNADQFLNQEQYGAYSDLFPAYLADGRIVFSSSRYPTRSHYDERRTYNLYVMNGDGSNLHRISSERGGMLHPTPLPDGRILATRWWNQFNQPSDQGIYNRIDNAKTDQVLADGTTITANPDKDFNTPKGFLPDGFPIREAPNTWHLMSLNPDGSSLQRFAWTPLDYYNATNDTGIDDTYHAAQPTVVMSSTVLYVAYTMQPDSTMVHSTLNTGIRVARPGVQWLYANAGDAIAGLSFDKAWNHNDESGPYAIHPWGLPDGQLLYSQSREDSTLPTADKYTEGAKVFDLQGSTLRYELYTMALDGSHKTPVPLDLNSIGLANADAMDAKPIVARTNWQTLADTFTVAPNDDPRLGNVPNSLPEYAFSLRSRNEIQTATIHNPNVYANPSLNTPFVNNSPPPGSVAFAQVWIDANQFTGAHCYDGYPQPCDNFRPDNQVRAVLWTEVPVTLQGEFTATIPADTPGFVVLRDMNHHIVRGWNRGYISIAQGNAWARPGETVTCVGCHMGHVSGSLDDVLEQAKQGWTNVAPYASVTASSYYAFSDPQSPDYQPFRPHYLNDRRGWAPVPAGGPPAPPSTFATTLKALAKQMASPFQQTARTVASGYQDDESSWVSAKGKTSGEWVELTWPSPMLVQSIRLVGPPPNGGDWDAFGQPAQDGPYYVESGVLQLYEKDVQIGDNLPVGRVEPLASGGTLITLPAPVVLDKLRFTIGSITGRWSWEQVAALNEVEVIGMAAEAPAPLVVRKLFLPMVRR